jgi:hypothetical protein
VRIARGLIPRETRQAFAPCIPSSGSWEAPLKLLGELFSDREWRNADMRIVLSNEYVRYAVVPLDPLLKRKEEREAYVRLQMENRFGSSADGWELCSSPAGKGKVVVSAVERKLLDAIERASDGHVRWVSLQPYLMAAFNRMRRDMSNDASALLLAESERMLLACFDRGGWVSVCNRHVEQSDFATAERLLNEESVLHGICIGEVWGEGLDDLPADTAGRSWRRCFPPACRGIAADVSMLTLQALD